jgi:hypothetical protein
MRSCCAPTGTGHSLPLSSDLARDVKSGAFCWLRPRDGDKDFAVVRETLSIALTRPQCQRREFCRDGTPVYMSIYELGDQWIELET